VVAQINHQITKCNRN